MLLSRICRKLRVSSESRLLIIIIIRMLKQFGLALFTCIVALGGSAIGSFTGAIKGQTTEMGIFRGFGVGAVAGAITAVELMDLISNGEPFSKIALICSLINGKIFMEWVSPAVLKAYQWQVDTMEASGSESSFDIFEVANPSSRGLSQDTIDEIVPIHKFRFMDHLCLETSCAICLQEMKDGESIRVLQNCGHFFHLCCIDKWLTRQGNCPICRNNV